MFPLTLNSNQAKADFIIGQHGVLDGSVSSRMKKKRKKIPNNVDKSPFHFLLKTNQQPKIKVHKPISF